MSRARDNADLGDSYGVLGAGVTGGSGLDAVPSADPDTIPHIIPAKLYPSSGNDLAGAVLVATTTGPNSSTVASSKYGTVQASDGRMYYYTDIKGSKPIKDPRIGAHFGSQRHEFSSVQLLEQETATHGENVYSVDGREWCRFVAGDVANFSVVNGNHGLYFNAGGGTNPDFTDYIEFTAYFNTVNFLTMSNTDARVNLSIDGVITSDFTGGVGTVASPLLNRFVDAGSVVNLVFSSTPTLGIHTVRIGTDAASHTLRAYGMELIVQDTTSTATKSQIQIPSQNVVSYGKKFTVSGIPHYDPFNGFVNDTTLFASVVDMDTSLGLGTATTWGAAWDKGSDNHIRPYNGGRVVKWVDSSGVIKTSVNMMPANAQNISTTAAAEITTPSATNTAYLPAFSDDAVDSSLAEVAKTFHWREFGNGNANGGAAGTFKDASMLDASERDIAYVMDDGLTSLSGSGVQYSEDVLKGYDDLDSTYITFIGTGFTIDTLAGKQQVAQNLPYGTHIFQIIRTSSSAGTAIIDGVTMESTSANFDRGTIESDVTFHQPKMPPIPEDAVVLADYMLMADYVKQTATSADIEGQISKGVRLIQSARDIFYNSSGAFSALSGTVKPSHPLGLRIHNANASSTGKLPFFGTAVTFWGESVELAGWSATLGGSTVTETHLDNTGGLGGHGDAMTIADGDAVTLGMTNTVVTFPTAYNFYGLGVATPIHTSSHYQTFETPFLHELVGGDRNMEQTNLIVTPDGKTWDQVTRDVSYVTNKSGYVASVDGVSGGFGNTVIRPDALRGKGATYFLADYWIKDWVVAYDRFICLKEGMYHITYTLFSHANDGAMLAYLALNNASSATSNLIATAMYNQSGANITYMSSGILDATVYLKRGDFICAVSDANSTIQGHPIPINLFQAERVG